MKNRLTLLILLAFLLGACAEDHSGEPGMTPDWRGVTVPCNIAPLNFRYTGSVPAGVTTTFKSGEAAIRVRGREVRPDPREWSALLASGSDITVSSSAFSEPWTIVVSRDSIDRWLTYRLIEPGYEVWDRVEIMERDLSTFDERPLSSWKNTDNSCMNCHIHKGSNSMFYLRGRKGGAILNRDGNVEKLSLKNDRMISSTVYGDLHPDGRWGVFSTNIIIPGFHTEALRRLEVYDTASDLAIADFDSRRMLTPAPLCDAGKFETFPCFSADGRSIYYCSADTTGFSKSVECLKYSLMKVSFDPRTGATGRPEIIWDGPAHNASVCHPKASPDGKWLLFTIADYGTFPIWHRECDLAMLNLQTGEFADLSEVNSDRSDTYHSWSSNSRWFVFASKRGDGQYGKPYICHVAADGTCGKPFPVPQEDPLHYNKTLKSYNIPDLGPTSAPYDTARVAELRNFAEAIEFE